ncbi:MAG: hypothetical protein OXG52_02975 [bacterium]|nr:hypothetical protein [bacterium]
MLLYRDSGRSMYSGLALAGLVIAVNLVFGIAALLAFIGYYWPDRRVNGSGEVVSIPAAGESRGGSAP